MIPRGRPNIVAFAIAVALLALPVFPVAAPPPPSRGAALLTVSNVVPSYVPGVLGLPFAARAGFDPTHLASVATPALSQDASILVTVTLQPRDPSFFAPKPFGSPPLTAAQVRDRYAPLPADYDALVSYFTGHGLTLVHEWPDGLAISVTGPASAVGAAFGTPLWDGTAGGRSVRVAASPPTLPAALEQHVASVAGLDDGFSTFTTPLRAAPLASPAAGRTTGLITPSALHKVYDLNGLYNYSGTPHWATGTHISLVLWGEGYAPSDLQTFFSSYYPAGFPAITLKYLAVDGAPAPSEGAVNDPSNVTSEMTLDLEWAGAAAPGATLTAVYAPDGPASNNYSPTDATLEDALHHAIQFTNASVVSMSFGTPDGSDASFQTAMDIYMSAAQNQGITVIAASGDTGGDLKVGCHGGPSPEYPAASSFAIAAGGTAPLLALDALGQVTGLDSEPAWNRSGGGFSVDYPAPSWQKVGSAAAPINAQGHRGIPDVAGPASDNLFYYHGQETAGAGTSFSAPLWAGIFAEMDAIRGTPIGFVTPRIYSVGAVEEGRTSGFGLVDITAGSNCVGPAAAGWDTATGWGSPRGLALYQELAGSFVNVTLTVSTDHVTPGSSFDATVLVTNATSHAPIGAASVTYELVALNYVGPCGGSLDVVTTTTLSDGTASSSLSLPGCFLGSQVQLTATVSGGSYFGSSATTLTVNLLGIAGFLAIIQEFPYNVIAFAGIIAAAVLIGWRIGRWRDRRARGRRPSIGPSPTGPAPRPGPAGGVGPGGPTVRSAAVAVAPAVRRPMPASASSARSSTAGPVSSPSVASPSGAPVGVVPSEPVGPDPEAEDGPTEIPIVPDHVSDAPSLGPAPLPSTFDDTPAGSEDAFGAIPSHARDDVWSSRAARERACGSCGAIVPPGATRCPSCGSSVA